MHDSEAKFTKRGLLHCGQYWPLGDTITGCCWRWSPLSPGRLRLMTITEPRLVPTHRHGQVRLSASIQVTTFLTPAKCLLPVTAMKQTLIYWTATNMSTGCVCVCVCECVCRQCVFFELLTLKCPFQQITADCGPCSSVSRLTNSQEASNQLHHTGDTPLPATPPLQHVFFPVVHFST